MSGYTLTPYSENNLKCFYCEISLCLSSPPPVSSTFSTPANLSHKQSSLCLECLLAPSHVMFYFLTQSSASHLMDKAFLDSGDSELPENKNSVFLHFQFFTQCYACCRNEITPAHSILPLTLFLFQQVSFLIGHKRLSPTFVITPHIGLGRQKVFLKYLLIVSVIIVLFF